MIDIAYWVHVIAVGAAIAYPKKLVEVAAEQSAKGTVAVLKSGIQNIKHWATERFGEKASLTKSLEKVIANPEDKKSQERLIEDLKDEEQNIESLEPLIQELSRAIPENTSTIMIHTGIKIDGNVHGGHVAGRDIHIYQPPQVKKND